MFIFVSLLKIADFQPSIVYNGLSWFHIHRFFRLIQLMKFFDSLLPDSKSSFLLCLQTNSLLILYLKVLEMCWASETVCNGPCPSFRLMTELITFQANSGRPLCSQDIKLLSFLFLLLIVHLKILVTLEISVVVRTKCIRDLRVSFLQLLIFLNI
jgi:hypothetical protein